MKDTPGSNLKEHIVSSLKADELLRSYAIDVEETDGNIILTGNVLSQEEAEHAEEVARSVPAVSNVTNLITVGKAPDDAIVTPFPDTSHHQDTPGSSGAFPVGAFDTSKD